MDPALGSRQPRDAGGHGAPGPHVLLPTGRTDPAGGTSRGGEVSFRLELHPHRLRGCSRRRLGRPLSSNCPRIALLGPRTSAETAGRHSGPELDVTKPRQGAKSSPPPAPALAMAPRMLGRGGAALLCLSALLAHGKCRGADSGEKMRRSPLEGRRGDWRKANPHPRTRSSSYLQPPSALAGAEDSSPALGTDPGPGKGGLGNHSNPLLVSKRGPNPCVRGRVRPQKSTGIRGIH